VRFYYDVVCQDQKERIRVEKMWNNHYKIEFEEILYGEPLTLF
jgi:hypothetical protein